MHARVRTNAGPVVTLTGKGSHLAIVYHRAAPSEDRQHLGFVVYNMEHKSARAHTARRGKGRLAAATTLHLGVTRL
jgi:hypothetical protein